jgi:hypothetical protein
VGEEQVNESYVLGFNLFQGDFGSGEKELSNKIVTTRKAYPKSCHICAGDISKGERSRVLTEVLDGHIGKYRVCNICCEAISKYEENPKSTWLDNRYLIGEKRRSTIRGQGTNIT